MTRMKESRSDQKTPEENTSKENTPKENTSRKRINSNRLLRQLRRRPSTKAVDKNKRKRLPRSLLYGLASFSIVALVALAFRPAPISVDIGQVTRGPLQVTIDAEGKTQVQERYVISAPVAGRLQRIELEAGDTVEAEELIAQIDPLPLNAQVNEAQARLQQLQAELAGVETQRPKSQAIAQAEAQLQSAEAARRDAAAQVTEAEAALEQAQRDRRRAQNLEASGAISRQQRESAELNETRQAQALESMKQQLDSAIAQVTTAQESIALLRAEQRDPDYLISAYEAQIAGVEAELTNLADEADRTNIFAPTSGTVLRILEESARFVSSGDPLLEIGEIDKVDGAAQLELVIDVLSADAVKIKPGDTILVEQWGGPKTLTATVSRIEPAAFTEVSALGVEEQRVNVIGTFADNDISLSELALGDGYRIEARIVIWEANNVLRVPVSALYRCDTAWCVFCVENGRAYSREIKIAQRSPNLAAVEAGLQVEETVILHPNDQIESGRKVEPQ
ncbi:MAG: efflux RND transporter periplasmic adaptor subunit [Phormidesmis sp.]